MRSNLIFAMIVIILVSLSLQAQDQNGTPPNPSSSNPDAVPVNISKGVLVSRGFSFDDRKRPTCEISGSEGTCHVEAFVYGEKTADKAGNTCSKLDRSSYVGHCLNGKLDGLSLVIADGSTKVVKEAFISYFVDGRIAYPALTSFLIGDLNFGVREKVLNYGCVYFGKWDESAKRCTRFREIYGGDILTESNAQKLRDGSFNLSYYRGKFLEFVQRK